MQYIRQSLTTTMIVAMFAFGYAVQPVHAAGNVTVTNCANDTELRNAASSPGTTTITFACGGPQTIPISGYIQVQGTVSINGGNQITLDGGGTSAFFQVFSSARLDLTAMTLQNGTFNAAHTLENFGTLTLSGVTMQKNNATGQGGALANYGTLQVSNSTFSQNTANGTNIMSSAGGAIANDGGNATIQNSTFSQNSATGSISRGGALANLNGNVSISGSTFTTNSAFDGGALNVASSGVVTVTNSLFNSNTASYGGAIESNGTLHVDHSSLRQNKATAGDGGAIWVLNGASDIRYSTIADNQSGTTGGGVSCYANTLSISNSTLSGNTAGSTGGAIYSTCKLTVINSTLSGNKAPANGGGGIYQAGAATSTVAASTITNNTATFGAGVYNDGLGTSTLTLSSTLLANNTTGNCDGVVASNGYNLSTDTNCANLTKTGDKQNIALPLGPLADNGGPTLTHLPLTGNPAIDAIPTPCTPNTDQRDAPRPFGTGCDIGAVEVGQTPHLLYLPIVIK